ncbi:MAG: peptidoglycan DD-metalloendopeptidase family protein [Nanobdellota archaeon]
MTKKAQMNILIFLLALVLTVSFILNMMDKNEENLGAEDTYIGLKQLSLLEEYQEGNMRLLYYEKLGSFLLPSALYDLGQEGGFPEKSPCGEDGNYNYWFNKTSDCKPDIEKGLDHHLNERLGPYTDMDYRFAVNDVVSAVATENLEIGDDEKYLPRPSFKMYTDYDLEIYDKLFSKADSLREQCMDRKDYQQCVAQRLSHLDYETGHEWSDDCNIGEEKVFYHFVENYKDCLESIGTDCTCEFSMDIGDSSLDGEYEMTLFENGNVSMGELEEELSVNPARFSPDGSSVRTPENLKFVFEYDEGELETSKLISGTHDKEMEPVSIYKSPPTEFQETSMYEFSNKEGESCGVYPRTAKVCVKGKNEYSIYADELRDLKIPVKFSIYFNDVYPPGRVDFDVRNKKGDEGAVVLNFTKREERDILKYNIYYSKEEISSVNNIEPDINISRDDVTEENFVKVIAGLEDRQEYDFVVTAEDVFGNEIEEVEPESVTPQDNLAPERVKINEKGSSGGVYKVTLSEPARVSFDWEKPEKNINGRKLVDLEGYFVYHSSSKIEAMPGGLEKDACTGNCNFVRKESFSGMFDEGTHYFVVSAIDEVPNYVHKSEGADDSEERTNTVDYIDRMESEQNEKELVHPVEKKKIVSCYGWRQLDGGQDWHDGIDFSIAEGTPVGSVAPGKVHYVCENYDNVKNGGKKECRGFGTNVIIHHESLGTYSRYSHLSDVNVEEGDKLSEGEVFARSGNTGYSEGDHLDFKYYLNGNFREKKNDWSRNPLCYLSSEDISFANNAYSCKDDDGASLSKCPFREDY